MSGYFVSVPGATQNGSYSTIALQFTSRQTAGAEAFALYAASAVNAAALLNQAIYPAAGGHSLNVAEYSGSGTPAATSGMTNELVVLSGTATVPTGYLGVIDASGGGQSGTGVDVNNNTYNITGSSLYSTIPAAETIYGASGDAGFETVLAGTGGLTFLAGRDNAFIMAGGGNNAFVAPGVGGSNYFISFDGGGANTIYGATGNMYVNAGTGHNLIFLGNGDDTVQSFGTDTIVAGGGVASVATYSSGSLYFGGSGPALLINFGGADTFFGGMGPETVFAASSGGVYFGENGSMLFVNGSGASTVVGGTANETLFGGTGNGLYFLGSGNTVMDAGFGNNTVVGGANSGPATIFVDGAGTSGTGQNGIVNLFSPSSTLLVAGFGNVTLNGAGATGNNTFFAGPGSDSLVGGSGNDFLFASTGSSTFTGGAGGNLFAFEKGFAGGSDVITDFGASSANQLYLLGYAGTGTNGQGYTATVSGSNTILTLSDGTKITLDNVTNLNPSQVKVS